MLSIAMYVYETPEEAASAAAVLSAATDGEEGLTLVTTVAGGLHLICDLRKPTSTDNVSDATAICLETLLSSALDLLLGTERDTSLH